MGAIDDHFPGMFKIDGHPVADHRLHLPQPPPGHGRVAHQLAGLQEGIHSQHRFVGTTVMSFEDRDVTALVGSRICHDLISPLGAISNGLELMTMAGEAEGPELGLIRESIDSANARIRLFRVAFGAAPHGAMMARSEIVDILDKNYLTSRVQVTWGPADEVARREVKIAFLAILCLTSALPWGGLIDVRRNPGGGWIAEAEAEKTRIEEEVWSVLDDPARLPSVDASLVHFPVLADMTAPRAQPLVVRRSDHQITMTF